MRELTLKATPSLSFRSNVTKTWSLLAKSIKATIKAIDDYLYEVDQFHRRLDRAKDRDFEKFWPYYIR